MWKFTSMVPTISSFRLRQLLSRNPVLCVSRTPDPMGVIEREKFLAYLEAKNLTGET
jgi:hypothetical protein